MFRPQDVLFEKGSLRIVWLLGKNTLGWTNQKSRPFEEVRRANIGQLCDLLMERFPPRSTTMPLTREDSRMLNMISIAVLMTGLLRMYKIQMDSFLKRVREFYEELKCRVLPFGEIDMPVEASRRRRRATAITEESLLNAVPENFGEFELDFGFDLVPFEQEDGDPSISAEHERSDEFDMTLAFMESGMERKRMRKESKMSKRNSELVDVMDDDELIQLLNTSRNTVRIEDITLNEPSLLPILRDPDEENFGFNGFDDPPPERTSTSENVDRIDDNPADAHQEGLNLPMEEVPANVETLENVAQVPVQPYISLGQRIRSSRTLSEEAPLNATAGVRKRRKRNICVIVDEETHLTAERMKATRQCGVPDRVELNDALASIRAVIPRGFVFPKHKKSSKTLQQILNVAGREPGPTLSKFTSSIRRGQSNKKLQQDVPETGRHEPEIDLPRGSIPAFVTPGEDPSAGKESGLLPGSISVSRGIIEAEENTLPSVNQLGNRTQPFSVENEPQADAQPEENLDMDPQYTINDDTVVGEEIRTPLPRMEQAGFEPHFEFPRVMVDESTGGYGNFKKFVDLFPPETTSRRKAALEFLHLLQLQKERKVRLHQESFMGDIFIELLN